MRADEGKPVQHAAEGPAVTIRPARAEDLPVLFLQQLDPVATRMAAFPPRDEEAFFAHWHKVLADETARTRTILADGGVAGHVAAFDLHGVREVGYWVDRAWWGRGIATRALEALLREEPARPLYAHVAAHNVGSIRVLEKCGFRLLREERGEVRGETVDERVLVLDA